MTFHIGPEASVIGVEPAMLVPEEADRTGLKQPAIDDMLRHGA